MTTIEKIRKVLIAKGIINTKGKHKGKPNLSKAEQDIGVSPGTLSKAFKRVDGDVHGSTQEKFIVKFHVKREWWETEKGEMFDEKPTSMPKGEDISMDRYVNDLRDLVDALKDKIKVLERDLADCRRKG